MAASNCKVINLFGGPSSGKSTAMAGLFYMMKKHGHRVEMAHEYVKLHVYAGTIEELAKNQLSILEKQNEIISAFYNSGQLEFVITDSPLLLSMIYGKGKPNFGDIKDATLDYFHSYQNINVFINRPDSFQKEGRVHNETEAKVIDMEIKDLMKSNNIPFIEVVANQDIEKTLYGLLSIKALKGY